MSILVVDDKQALSDMVAQYLRVNFEIHTKRNGFEAMKWMQAGNIPDLIITDLEMPVMDGFELIKGLKQSGFFKNIPIIVLSCKDNSADRIKCLKLGADDYMIKPFNPEELMIRIEKLLVRQQ